MTGKPLRPVTAKCFTCARRFAPGRVDQRYCSDACRQRGHRARSKLDDLDQQIEAARRNYWSLIREKEMAKGSDASQVVTAEAQFVDGEGNVYMHGELVGRRGRDKDCPCSHCRLG